MSLSLSTNKNSFEQTVKRIRDMHQKLTKFTRDSSINCKVSEKLDNEDAEEVTDS